MLTPGRWMVVRALHRTWPVILLTLCVLLGLAAPAMAQSPAAPAATSAPTAVAGPTQAPAAAPSPARSPAAVSPMPSAPLASPAPTPTPPPCPNPTHAPPPPPTPTPSHQPGPTRPPPGPTPTPAPTPHPNLCPAPFGAAPWELLAWAFTPVFQALFMGLVFFYNLGLDIGLAIIGLTIVIRLLLVPLFRKQIVSQRRMQMIQPEMRAIQLKYKGNRAKISEEQMKLYRERGVNPASGCLPALLQMLLLLPMYQVFSQGLSAPNISSMLSVFGQPVMSVTCYDPTNPLAPCINPAVPWLSWLPQITSNGLEFYPGGLPPTCPRSSSWSCRACSACPSWRSCRRCCSSCRRA